jgi:hypothetical protein
MDPISLSAYGFCQVLDGADRTSPIPMPAMRWILDQLAQALRERVRRCAESVEEPEHQAIELHANVSHLLDVDGSAKPGALRRPLDEPLGSRFVCESSDRWHGNLPALRDAHREHLDPPPAVEDARPRRLV